jgi:hypothetical protein
MTKWIRIENDWAFWVDADSFEFRRTENRAPIYSIVIAKNREFQKEGSSYIKTTYNIASEAGLIRLNRKTASEILSNRAIDYIQKTGRWPPCMNFKRVLKSGDVELFFTLTEHDKFTLRVTAEMVNENPLDLLLGLKQYEKLGTCQTSTNQLALT